MEKGVLLWGLPFSLPGLGVVMGEEFSDLRSNEEKSDDVKLHKKIDRALELTEKVERELSALTSVTNRQAEMIDRQAQMQKGQAEMITKMWEEVRPILTAHQQREQLKADLYSKLVSGTVYGIIGALLLVVWQGIKYFIWLEK